MNKFRLSNLLWLTGLLVLVASRVDAQTLPAIPVPINGIYPFAEQMPTLASLWGEGDVQENVQAAFNKATASQDDRQGIIYVSFIITDKGQAVQPRIVQGLGPALDAAALAAVRQLPTLKPARQGGMPVSVRVTTRILVPDTSSPFDYLQGEGRPPGWDQPIEDKVYERVDVMPTLPGWGGRGALIDALQQGAVLTQPAHGYVVVKFVVDKQGLVSDATIARSLSAKADAAVLAAVQRLPRFSPGAERGQPARVLLTVPVLLNYGPVAPSPGKTSRPRRP